MATNDILNLVRHPSRDLAVHMQALTVLEVVSDDKSNALRKRVDDLQVILANALRMKDGKLFVAAWVEVERVEDIINSAFHTLDESVLDAALAPLSEMLNKGLADAKEAIKQIEDQEISRITKPLGDLSQMLKAVMSGDCNECPYKNECKHPNECPAPVAP